MKRRAVRPFRVGIIVLALLVLQCWPSDAPNYSKRIQALLGEVKAVTDKQIIIKTIPATPQALQGHSNEFTDRIVITIMSGVSPDYDDALLAHELFHVILNSRGFAGGGIPSQDSDAGIAEADRQRVDQALAYFAHQINSCFSDELIDRETLKRGFNPKLLLDKSVEWTVEQSAAYEANEGDEWPDLGKKGQAAVLFCLSKRLSVASMHRIETALEPKLGLSIFQLERKLALQFRGNRCDINEPDACYQLTLQLRNATGLKGIILLRNPRTSVLE